jgi:two-component system, chemotaxis family, protein-glutamate methylesterase/glutaminase
MSAIRVLIVDDSVVIRKVLSEVLTSDPSIEVVGTAADGNIALTKIPLLTPELITLDIEKPGLSGLETLIVIRKSYPSLPVIMFSTLIERGAVTTLEALSLGASDWVTKLSNTGSVEQTCDRIRSELVPKVKELCRKVPHAQPLQPAPPPQAKLALPTPRLSDRIDVVAIGTSTGGPNALAAVLPALSENFPVPIVLVQHMPKFSQNYWQNG